MKKKIIYSSALAALLSASSILAGGPEFVPVEDYFSGFYVGLIGGLHHADFEGSSVLTLNNPVTIPALATTFAPGTISSNDMNGRSLDGYVGGQAGFGWTFNHVWYLGIQGWGEGGSQNSTAEVTNTVINFNALNIITDQATATQTVTAKLDSDYGVAAKFGYVVAPRTLVYGKVGASWADLKVTNISQAVNNFDINVIGVPILNVSTTAAAISSAEDTKVGLLLGLGVEQFIYQDILSLNLEYNYVSYATVNTGPAQLVANTTATVIGGVPTPVTPAGGVDTPLFTSGSTKVRVNSFMAGLNVYFGRNWF